MAGSSSASATQDTVISELRRNSDDVGWQYGFLPNPNDQNTLQCKLCGHTSKGGVHRMKKHIAGIRGDVRPCSKASNEDKKICKAALEGATTKKKAKRMQDMELREEVIMPGEKDAEDFLEVNPTTTSKRPKTFGPIDRFTIDPEEAVRQREKEKGKQTTMKDAFAKEARERVNQYVARWVYQAGIAFHAVTLDSFTSMMEAVGAYGRGYKGPSRYELGETLLRKEVEKTKLDLIPHKEEWKRTGCSIMTDAWTDRRHRSIMNMCVNCKLGTSFHRSLECSEDAHTGDFIFQCVDSCIEEVGPEHIIQVVTDNASANMATTTLLKEKRPNFFWTSCAAHTIDLVLEAIGKRDKFKNAIEKGRALTVFIYAHHKTLAMMRRYTQKRDIVRPGITRFATSFLTLQSIMEKKEKLRLMFTSDEWTTCKYSRCALGRAAAASVLNPSFWSGITLALRVFSPLVRVLRIADGDVRPAMRFIVGSLFDARKEIIAAYKGVESGYKPILSIIDEKVKGRLDSPLHMACFYLNPWYYFKYQEDIEKDQSIASGLMSCIETFYPDVDVQDKVMTEELFAYKNTSGLFGRPMAVRQRSKNDDAFDPAHWWSNFGSGTPFLQNMAIKVLNLTCSSSGCERNWSTFEGIHTKKRNRLEASKLNNLVYVQFNAKLKAKGNKARNGKEKDPLVAKEASNAVAWLVEGGDNDEEEVFPGSGLTWSVVGEASGANEVSQPRRSARGAHASSSSTPTPSGLGPSRVPLRDIDDTDIDELGDTDEESEEEDYVDLDDDSDNEGLLPDRFGEEDD